MGTADMLRNLMAQCGVSVEGIELQNMITMCSGGATNDAGEPVATRENFQLLFIDPVQLFMEKANLGEIREVEALAPGASEIQLYREPGLEADARLVDTGFVAPIPQSNRSLVQEFFMQSAGPSARRPLLRPSDLKTVYREFLDLQKQKEVADAVEKATQILFQIAL